MPAKKQWTITIEDSEYKDLPDWLCDKARVYFNDYEDYKDDPYFKALYKKYRKAREELDTYKFNKRHGKL